MIGLLLENPKSVRIVENQSELIVVALDVFLGNPMPGDEVFAGAPENLTKRIIAKFFD